MPSGVSPMPGPVRDERRGACAARCGGLVNQVASRGVPVRGAARILLRDLLDCQQLSVSLDAQRTLHREAKLNQPLLSGSFVRRYPRVACTTRTVVSCPALSCVFDENG